MRIAVGLFLLLAASLLQVTLIARVELLRGNADLVLLTLMSWLLLEGNKADWKWGIPAGLILGYLSALPEWVLLAGYIAAAGICQLLHKRIWQVTLLTLITATLVGTLAVHAITLGYLWLSANPLPLGEALNQVTLPSVILNLILVFPVYAFVGEFGKLLIPNEEPV
jgi:hypothetical protein